MICSFLLAAVVALTLTVTPAQGASNYMPCGNATVHGRYGMGWSDFHVKGGATCKSALRAMKTYVGKSDGRLPAYANGWRITAQQFKWHGRKGNALFYCFVFGVD